MGLARGGTMGAGAPREAGRTERQRQRGDERGRDAGKRAAGERMKEEQRPFSWLFPPRGMDDPDDAWEHRRRGRHDVGDAVGDDMPAG
jgi:E3 ubiquitin-protein ligase RNF115/126